MAGGWRSPGTDSSGTEARERVGSCRGWETASHSLLWSACLGHRWAGVSVRGRMCRGSRACGICALQTSAPHEVPCGAQGRCLDPGPWEEGRQGAGGKDLPE